jgi:hypothetical protein
VQFFLGDNKIGEGVLCGWTDGFRLGAVVIVCDRFKCVLFDESGRTFPEGNSKQWNAVDCEVLEED